MLHIPRTADEKTILGKTGRVATLRDAVVTRTGHNETPTCSGHSLLCMSPSLQDCFLLFEPGLFAFFFSSSVFHRLTCLVAKAITGS